MYVSIENENNDTKHSSCDFEKADIQAKDHTLKNQTKEDAEERRRGKLTTKIQEPRERE